MDVEGVGTTTLTVTGRSEIDVDVDYAPSEDPIEAMSLLAAAIVTESEITIRRITPLLNGGAASLPPPPPGVAPPR